MSVAEIDPDVREIIIHSDLFKDWIREGKVGISRELRQFVYDFVFPDDEADTPSTVRRYQITHILEVLAA